MTNKEKIEFNKRAIGKEVHVINYAARGKIVDVKDENTFKVLIDNEVKDIDVFDIRYV